MVPPGDQAVTVQIKTYKVIIPSTLEYSRNHLWLSKASSGTRCGFTTFATRQLGDIYRLEWTVKPGTRINRGQEIGSAESSKSTSALYAPEDGVIAGFNSQAIEDPAAIATDPYNIWLFAYAGEVSGRLGAEAYAEYLALATGGQLLSA